MLEYLSSVVSFHEYQTFTGSALAGGDGGEHITPAVGSAAKGK